MDESRDLLATWMSSIDGRLLRIEARLDSLSCASASTSARLSTWVSAVSLALAVVAVLAAFLR